MLQGLKNQIGMKYWYVFHLWESNREMADEVNLTLQKVQTSAKDFGCSILGVYEAVKWSKYSNSCILQIATFICAGFCDMGSELARVRKLSQSARTKLKVPFKDECNCCLPEARSLITLNLTLQCITSSGHDKEVCISARGPQQGELLDMYDTV